MAYAGRTVSKFEHARRLAASLAYLMISQRDAVGLVTFDAALRSMIPPRSAPGHFSVVCNTLEKTRTGGETRLSGILHALAERIHRRGTHRHPLRRVRRPRRPDLGAEASSSRRREVLFSHTIAPEEEEFPFRSPARFRSLEQPGHEMRIDPAVLRATYLERFREFCRTLEERIHAMNADYQRASTAEAIEKTLLDYLSSRSRRGRLTA